MISGQVEPVSTSCNKMLISMKTSGGICVAVAILLFVNTRSASTAVGELMLQCQAGCQ